MYKYYRLSSLKHILIPLLNYTINLNKIIDKKNKRFNFINDINITYKSKFYSFLMGNVMEKNGNNR